MPESSFSPQSPGAERIRLKICGLREPDQAAAIAAMGVDAIGVVAVQGSPRFLPAVQRSPLFAAARSSHVGCFGVLVVADPADADLPALAAGNGHQVVQLHGGETVERCHQLRRALGAEVELWKALRIRSPEDLDRCVAYGEAVDALLLDAWVPGQLGGTGCPIPLDWLEGFAPKLPWWLAGGISPETVEEVLQRVHPHGLDASSGVERQPGCKDLQRVRNLLEWIEPFQQVVSAPSS
ncbi:MAG: phosphoribosylanthranilate isomerase [Cyanobacteriota bacterium]